LARLIHFCGTQAPATDRVTSDYPCRDQNPYGVQPSRSLTHSSIPALVLPSSNANPRSPPSSPSKAQRQKGRHTPEFFLLLREEYKRVSDFLSIPQSMTVYIFKPIPFLPSFSLPPYPPFFHHPLLHTPSTPKFATCTVSNTS